MTLPTVDKFGSLQEPTNVYLYNREIFMKKLILSAALMLYSWQLLALTIAYVDFPPYEWKGKDDRAHGIQVELVKIIFKRAGIPLKLVHRPFKRALESAKKGTIDGLFNFYKIPARLKIFDYSVPVIDNPLVLFVLKDSKLKYKTLKDLKRTKVGVMRGYTYGAKFDSSKLFTRQPANSHINNYEKLLRGRVGLYPCDRLVGMWTLKMMKAQDKVKVVGVPLKVMDGHIGFTKGKHIATVKKINKVISKMKKSGELEKLITKLKDQVFSAGLK